MPILNGYVAEGAVSLDQEYQQTNAKFAFVSWEWSEGTGDMAYTQLHSWCLCRDFLSDIVAEHNSGGGLIDFPVYGLDCPNIKLEEDHTLLAIRAPKGTTDAIRAGIPLLRKYEEKVGWAGSLAIPINDTTTIIVGDPRWQSLSIYISMYSLLLRSLAHTSPDTGSLEEVLERLHGNRSLDKKLCDYIRDLRKANFSLTDFMEANPQLSTCSNQLGHRNRFKLQRELSKRTIHDHLGILTFVGRVYGDYRVTKYSVGRAWVLKYRKFLKTKDSLGTVI